MTTNVNMLTDEIEIVFKIAKERMLIKDYLPEILAEIDREIVKNLCDKFEPKINAKLNIDFDDYGGIYSKIIFQFQHEIVQKLVSEYYQKVHSKIDVQALVNATFISTVKNLAGNK